jgi:hypothetical protein
MQLGAGKRDPHKKGNNRSKLYLLLPQVVARLQPSPKLGTFIERSQAQPEHRNAIEMSQTEPDLMPRQNPNPKDVDFLIAKELNQMSFKERELVYEELHGVDKIIEETPEFLEQHLEVMELELCNIPRKPAYDEALRISGSYVTDRKFRLMFLRSEYFDAQKAAIRLVKYLQGKVEYFGPGVLVRPLYLTDLDENDQKTLRSGYLQILPARDRAGRVVLGNFKKLTTKCYKNSENLVRSCQSAMLLYYVLDGC